VTADLVQTFVFLLLLVPGAAAEELLPKILGVGFPVLLASVQIVARRCLLADGVFFALAAGAVEDAICALPPMTSVSFFLVVALLSRWLQLPRAMIALVYPCYQVWLATWMPNLGGGVFVRILVAVPVGLFTTLMTSWVYLWLRRKAALDDVC